MTQESEIIKPIDCTTRCIDAKWQDKIIVYTQEDVVKDEFRDPKTFYYVNQWGDFVYLKTLKYSRAQEMVDEISGKMGFFKVRTVIKAQVR